MSGTVFGHWLKRTLPWLATLVVTLILSLLVAYWGVNHPNQSYALHHWFHRTQYYWLIWRLGLYSGLSWGIWQVWQAAQGQFPARRILKRIAIASTCLVLLVEYSLFGGGVNL